MLYVKMFSRSMAFVGHNKYLNKWWRVEKSKMASKMATISTDCFSWLKRICSYTIGQDIQNICVNVNVNRK